MEPLLKLDVVNIETTRETIPVGRTAEGVKELAIGQTKARIFVRSPISKTVYALEMPAEMAEEFNTLVIAKDARDSK